MKVRVMLERERGAYRQPYGQRMVATGQLHLTRRRTGGRTIPVAVLQLLSADRQWPSLFEPRLADLSADTMRFIGYERDGNAWVMQEWLCEVLPTAPND